MRVNHLSIAVRDLDAALAWFGRHFPIVMMHDRLPGHTGDYTWCDFFIGAFKLELIASAAPGSFVERFIAKRGEGLHHLSLEAPDFERVIATLERGGVRIVDRFESGPDDKTAFISPRSAFGTLIQFWKAMDEEPPRPPIAVHRYGDTDVRVRVNHVSIAVRDIDATLAFFTRYFPVEIGVAPRVGYEPSFRFANFQLNGYKIELIAENPAHGPGFVDTFLEKRGEGFHHVSIDVDRLAPVLDALARDGARIVGHYHRPRDGRATAFVSPRSAFGVLIQFWEHPEMTPEHRLE
jgi:catechol 2,3-dioxygenase-like lactoylglutathione lyase family enzyme